jgi:hypothetical protein
MKATLEFDLSEEAWAFSNACRGSDWRAIVEELDNMLRGKIKDGSGSKTASIKVVLQDIRDELYDIVNCRGLRLHTEN